MTSELQDYSLPRTGRPPLAFRGEFLEGVDGSVYLDERGRNPRWHDIELYRTEGGIYILHVRYRTEWPGEVGYDDTMTTPEPPGVWTLLAATDPTAHVVGFPQGVHGWEKKQGRLLADVRARFDRCVSDLFAGLGSEFSERVE